MLETPREIIIIIGGGNVGWVHGTYIDGNSEYIAPQEEKYDFSEKKIPICHCCRSYEILQPD